MNSKARITVSSLTAKVELIIGILWSLFWGVCLIVGFTEPDTEGLVGTSVVCIVIGILVIRGSIKRSRLVKDFKKYVTAIASDGTGSITRLAKAIGTPEDVVKKNLEKMIKKQFFVNAFINNETNGIVIGNIIPRKVEKPQSSQTQSVSVQATSQPSVKKQEYVEVVCTGCGAKVQLVKGTASECEYCGSALSAK